MYISRKLGIMYYTLLLTTFLYVIMYNVIYQKGYFEYETPVGAIATEIQRDVSVPSVPSYALTRYQQVAFDTTTLHYCSGSATASSGAKNCIIWDKDEAFAMGIVLDIKWNLSCLFLISDTKSLDITTHVTDYIEERVCAKSDTRCSTVWKEVETEEYYLADIENFKVQIID